MILPEENIKAEEDTPVTGEVVFRGCSFLRIFGQCCACRTGGHGFESQSEPPPMLADMSVSMLIKKAQLPC